jgi:arylsulfatase A-like enzyme/Tfp pilus assembly protein PilF
MERVELSVSPAREFRRPGLAIAAGLLILLHHLLGPVGLPAAPDSKPNVVFITIDTLRADRLGCYGYKQVETPHIDGLARQRARFTRAYSPVPITLPAHAVLFTGAFPVATGMHDFSGNKLSESVTTLAKVLKDSGYSTAAFVGSAVLDSRFGLNQGFDTYFDHFNFGRLDEAHLDRMERRGDLVVDEALNWLKTNPRRPIFLWVHLYDPHDPYTPPEPYAARYREHPYDGEIAFADAQVGRLVKSLKEQALFDGSVFVAAGDHGEGLGDHGERTHGFFIYNSTLQVPLIFKIPGVAPRVVDDEVSLVDVMPTLLQILKLPFPPTVQGRSLLSGILGRPTSGASNLVAENYLPLLHFRWSQLRALQSRGLKFIDAPRPELYDTRTDPGELKNLFDTRQSHANDLRNRLYGLLRRFTPAAEGASAEKELTDPGLLERLRSLGYVAVDAGTFMEASGEPLPDPKDRIQVYELVSAAMADGQHGRYQESLRKLREAEKVEANSVTIHYLAALNYYRLKNYPRAIERFTSALRLNSKMALATYYLGLAQVQTGNLEGAIVSFHSALEQDPTNFSAAFNLGAAYTKQKRAEEALQAFRRAVEILPEYAEAHGAMGELYLYLRQPNQAVEALERAVAIAPGMRRAHYHLGRAYQVVGRTADAEREFARAKSP